MLSQTGAHIMTIINITVFHTRFLSPTDQKCAESVTYWQFFYYRPPGKFRFTHLGKIVKMLNCYAKNSTHTHIYIYNMIIDMDFLYQFIQSGIDCTTFHRFFSWNVRNFFFFFFKSSQVCDWLAKWIIMLRFMDLRWPRVFRRSNAVLFNFVLLVCGWVFDVTVPLYSVKAEFCFYFHRAVYDVCTWDRMHHDPKVAFVAGTLHHLIIIIIQSCLKALNI